MFERFRQRYKVTFRLPSNPSDPIITTALEDTPGYEGFMREYAGATFNDGVYRVHTLEGRIQWTDRIIEVFPEYKDQISTFGFDWMGRQFALDAGRRERDQPLVLLFDPGFGEVLQIPGTFLDFHDQVLITASDAAFLDHLFEGWLRAGNRPPGPTECVGYKVPLFLGGVDRPENFELSDMEVYWSFSGQIRAQTRNLPEGTPIGKLTIE
jgi:hypothetical protein